MSHPDGGVHFIELEESIGQRYVNKYVKGLYLDAFQCANLDKTASTRYMRIQTNLCLTNFGWRE